MKRDRELIRRILMVLEEGDIYEDKKEGRI